MKGPDLVIVIPLDRLVICGEDHAYDGTMFTTACPNCASAERVPIEKWIGSKKERKEDE